MSYSKRLLLFFGIMALLIAGIVALFVLQATDRLHNISVSAPEGAGEVRNQVEELLNR